LYNGIEEMYRNITEGSMVMSSVRKKRYPAVPNKCGTAVDFPREVSVRINWDGMICCADIPAK
jgi:hypothetical protein